MRYLILFVILAGSVLVRAAEPAAALLAEANAGFEQGENDLPTGWKTWASPGNADAVFSWSSPANVPEGKKAASLSHGTQGLTMAWVMTSPIPVEPGTKYRLNLSSLQNGTRGAKFQIRLNWSPTSSRVSLDHKEILPLETREDASWQKESFIIQAPEDCEGLTIELQQIGRTEGEISFDDLRLTAVP